jgi:hypothetical protein
MQAWQKVWRHVRVETGSTNGILQAELSDSGGGIRASLLTDIHSIT